MSESRDNGHQVAGFIWVHTDEQTASKGKGSQINANARAHVMGDYVRKKNAATIKRLKNDSSLDTFMGRHPDPIEDQESTPTIAEIKPVRLPSKGKRRSLRGYTTSEDGKCAIGRMENTRALNRIKEGDEHEEVATDLHGSEDTNLQLKLKKQIQQLANYNRAPASTSSVLCLGSGSSEPFSAAAAPIGTFEHHLIKFFVECLTPDIYGAEKESIDSILKRKAHQMVFHTIIADSGLLFSLFAVACANEEARQGHKSSQDSQLVAEGRKNSFYYRMKTIQAVQRAIAEIKDPATDINTRLIGIMLGLLGSDLASSDYTAASTHNRAICHFVMLKGGIHTLNNKWAEDVIVADVSISVINITAPILPLTWAPADLPNICNMNPENGSVLHALGQRLVDTESSIASNADMITTARRLRQIVWVAEFTTAHAENNEINIRQWISLSTPAVEHRLLSSHQYHHQLSEQHMLRSTCVALLMFTRSSLRSGRYRLEAYLYSLLTQLKSDLLWTDLQTLWAPFTDTLVWVLFMGLYAAAKLKAMDAYEWFTLQALRAVDFLLLKEWSEVSSLLQEFFYLERIHGESMRSAWNQEICPRLRPDSAGALSGTKTLRTDARIEQIE